MKTTQSKTPRVDPYVVQPLGADDRPRIVQHLLALDGSDRFLRFRASTHADLIARYVDGIDFDAGVVLGAVTPDRALIGVAHIALDAGVAELGISVATEQRQKGVAGALAAAGLREAQRLGARQFRFASAATNDGMRRLAQQLGMIVSAEGSEMTAHRSLDRGSDASSIMAAQGCLRA